MVFDNVRVPWSRVFCHRDIPLMRDMYFKTPAHVMGNHQSNWRFAEKLKLMVGIAHRACEMAGVINIPAIQQTLGRLAAAEASLLGLMAAQIDQHQSIVNGHVHVNRRFLYAALQWCASNYAQVAEEVRSLMGAGPFLLPADPSVFDNPQTRQTFEKFYGGPPHIMDLYSFFNCPWSERRAAVDQIVKDMGSADDLAARRKPAAE